MLRCFRHPATSLRLPAPHRFTRTSPLVNVKPKLPRDRALDRAVSREKHLPQTLYLLHLLSLSPSHSLPLSSLPRPFLSHLHLHPLFRISTSTPRLLLPSPISLPLLHHRRDDDGGDALLRLRLLLSLSPSLSLSFPSLLAFSPDLGLPPQFPLHLHLRLPSPPLPTPLPRLLLDSHAPSFPLRFPPGYGMSRRWMRWLDEFQCLPYTSPYDHTHSLDPRTDVAEKRVVAICHEVLHLMLTKKTERRNFAGLRKPLGLPFRFTKVFERHPGIFYISKKLGRQTVVLREAYGRDGGLEERWRRHPAVEFREKVIEAMKGGVEEEEGNGSEREEVQEDVV